MSLLLCAALAFSALAFEQPPQRIRFATVISHATPEYPAAAKRAGIKGTVRLDAVIGKDGHVKSVKLINGKAVLVEAAEEAVMKWVFQPTHLNGEPIEVVMEIQVPFGHVPASKRPIFN